MATIECDHETVAGVTLVACRLASDVRRRVTVEPTHDGPIWPPRRQGVPAAGWTDGSWTGEVPADGRRALGYATPTDPADPPARIVATESPTDEAVTAREAIRSLGDPRPTRDAVPPATDRPASARSDATAGGETPATTRPSASVEDAEAEGPATDGSGAATAAADLDAIETRLWTAADLAAVSTVEEASAAVERAGGMDAVRSLSTRLEADRERLADLASRTDRLLDEVESVDVPLDSLERLV